MAHVNFIGAGPGAADLLTIRGKRLIGEADVIIYAGSLVNPELLEFAKSGCEIHNSATMTLDEVIDVIKAAADCERNVVRLHTGDPSLYGAVREQMDRLAELGICFEICPGVSSFCAAAASLKAEYTLPGVSQTVILTRAAGRTPTPEGESIRALAAHGATMILFLSAGLLGTVSRDLIEGGYAPDTPAAIIYKASWPDELILRCTVANLEPTAAENKITSTALICVGSFLSDEYDLSRLYSADFSTGCREAKTETKTGTETDGQKSYSSRLTVNCNRNAGRTADRRYAIRLIRAAGSAFVRNGLANPCAGRALCADLRRVRLFLGKS